MFFLTKYKHGSGALQISIRTLHNSKFYHYHYILSPVLPPVLSQEHSGLKCFTAWLMDKSKEPEENFPHFFQKELKLGFIFLSAVLEVGVMGPTLHQEIL